MKPNRPLVLLLIAVACLLFASCEDSRNPLSDPEKAELDAKLPGVWRLRDEHGHVTYYHAGRAGDKLPEGVMRVIGVTHWKDGKLRRPGKEDMLAFSTRIGDGGYLNVTILSDQQAKSLSESGWRPEAAKVYWIIKYQVQGDTLALQFMDPDARKQAIKAGKIKGIVEGKKAVITDTTENFRGVIAAGGGKNLFSKKVVKLERVK